MKKIGFLSHRMMEESNKLRNPTISMPELVETKTSKNAENEETTEANILEEPKNRLEEMQRQGFGERSSALQRSPYRNKIQGQTARVQASRENQQNQPTRWTP